MKQSVKQSIENAIKLKMEQNLTYKEIAIIMNRPLGTIKRWLAPLKIPTDKEKVKKSIAIALKQRKENVSIKKKNIYEKAMENVKNDFKDNYLRDFVNIYLGEGSKKDNKTIHVINSDPKIILLSLAVMKKYFLKENKKISMGIRYYKTNDNEQELFNYWSKLIGFDNKVVIKTYLQTTNKPFNHNNSNKFGLVYVRICDVCARQKLNAYMDYLKEEWTKEFEIVFETKFDRSIIEVKATNNSSIV